MREFMVLLSEIFIISCLQTIIEVFLDKDDNPYQVKIVNIACFVGSLYLLIQFIMENIAMQLDGFARFFI